MWLSVKNIDVLCHSIPWNTTWEAEVQWPQSLLSDTALSTQGFAPPLHCLLLFETSVSQSPSFLTLFLQTSAILDLQIELAFAQGSSLLLEEILELISPLSWLIAHFQVDLASFHSQIETLTLRGLRGVGRTSHSRSF